MSAITTVVEKKVFPASPHPAHIYPFSMNDIVMPPVNIRWIAFYENNGSKDFMSPEILESSLAKVLDLYPLLAGKLVYLPSGAPQIEYNPDDLVGCTFTVATANFSLESLRKNNFAQKEIPDEFKPGSVMATTDSIFSAKITKLTCGSVVMSYAMHHQVGDGYSVHNLIEKWAKICRGVQETEIEKPLLDRSVLSLSSDPLVDNHPEYIVVDPAVPAPVPSYEPSVLLVITFSPEKLADLKRDANIGLEPGKWVSTNDCIVLLMWRVLTRVRELGTGDTTVCGIAVDGRKKWETHPGAMAQYFGNFVTFPTVRADAGVLLQSSLGAAALLLRDQVEKMTRDRIQSSLNWVDRVKEKANIRGNFNFSTNDIFISSWLTFPMYDCDFGWGKPSKALLHAPGNDGISLVMPKGPAKDTDKNGLEVVFGVKQANASKVLQDAELSKYATVKID